MITRIWEAPDPYRKDGGWLGEGEILRNILGISGPDRRCFRRGERASEGPRSTPLEQHAKSGRPAAREAGPATLESLTREGTL